MSSARYRKNTKSSMTLAEMLGVTDMTEIREGEYTVQCTVQDVNGKKQTSEPVSVTIKRQITDIALYNEYKDITGKFIAFRKVGNDALKQFPVGGTFEADKTYRYTVFLSIDTKYRNENGGVLHYDENVKAYCSDMRTITKKSYENIIEACIYFTVQEHEYEIGDVNMDGSVDVLDAAVVQKYAAGKAELTAEQLELADVNNDNNVDVLDAAEIQKYAAGKITEFKKK